MWKISIPKKWFTHNIKGYLIKFKHNFSGFKDVSLFWSAFLMLLLISPGICGGTDYYVDSGLGLDENNGTFPTTPWKTVEKINKSRFLPGDRILFKRGGTWEETLVISSSGISGAPIVFSAYGTGPDPVIKCSNRYTNWELKGHKDGLYYWYGRIRGVRNHWGAMLGQNRIPTYRGYDVKNFNYSKPSSIWGMQSGSFYSPHNKEGFFLTTPTSRNPVCEVGLLQYGIHVRNKVWIMIENLEIFGPGGSPQKGRSKDSYQLLIDNSHNIIIKKCVFRFHNRHGVMVNNKSSNIRLESITSYGHGNTGVYFWEAGNGNAIEKSNVYQCGNILSDKGDLGLIGVYMTPGVKIEQTTVFSNGHAEIKNIDAAISFVQSRYCELTRCIIKDAGGTAVQFAANSDFATISYNIIDVWGRYSPENSNEGIRIGGGVADTSAIDSKILNNILINGNCHGKNRAAIRVEKRSNAGLKIINNILSLSAGCLDIYAAPVPDAMDWEISHNYFHALDRSKFIINGRYFDVLPFELGRGNIYASSPPLIDLEELTLLPGSPCINKGKSVGLKIDINGTLLGESIDIGPFEND